MIYQEETGGRFHRFPLFFCFGGTETEEPSPCFAPVSFLLYSGWEEMV